MPMHILWDAVWKHAHKPNTAEHKCTRTQKKHTKMHTQQQQDGIDVTAIFKLHKPVEDLR